MKKKILRLIIAIKIKWLFKKSLRKNTKKTSPLDDLYCFERDTVNEITMDTPKEKKIYRRKTILFLEMEIY